MKNHVEEFECLPQDPTQEMVGKEGGPEDCDTSVNIAIDSPETCTSTASPTQTQTHSHWETFNHDFKKLFL